MRATSLQGIELIKRHESCALKAYQDTGGVWTIGWGHTGPDVYAGLTWSQAKADSTLVRDLANAENCIHSHVFVPLTQGEFDALVSFIFNVGCGAFRDSTMLRLLNDSDYDGAAGQFRRWNHDNGKELAELTRRREEERQLFERWLV